MLDQTSNGALANNVVGTGSLTLTGGGTLTLSGASQLGSVDVSTGELIVTGTLDSAISIDNGATLQGGSANLAGSIVDNGALIFSQTSDGTYAGPITGTGSMTVTGGSALTLSGTSNVATTEVAAGSLTVTGSLASAFTVDAGGTLQGSTSTLSAQGTVADNGTLVFDQAAAGTFANAIEGSGAIVLQGGGTLTLSGASNVSTTEVSSGTLIVSGSLTSAFAIDAGATLQGGASNLLGAVTDNGMLVFDQVNAGTFAGAIDGSGAILLKGGGALTLSGASNVATTEVSAGALIVTGSLTSAFTIDTGATLQGGSVNLLAQGAVADNGTLIFNQTSAGTFANAIDGSGAIVLDGGAALTLSSASQVATTTVDNGALIVTGSLVSAFAIGQHGVLQGSAASLLAQGAVADNGELVFDQAGAGTFANVIDGSGAVVLEGGGALTLSGTSSVAATLVDNGALIVTGSLASAFTIGQHGVLQGAVSTLLAQGPIVDNGSLVLDQVGDGALLNAVVGSGGLTVTGGGALTLSGASSVGSTEVAAGSLIVTGFLGSAFTIDKGATLRGGSSNLQGAVTDNGALVFDQTNTGTFGGAINGSGAIVVEGGGVLGLSGTSSVATTTVEAGALVVTGSLASAFIIDKGAMLQGGSANLHGAVTDNGVLVFDQLSDGTFAGAINGSGVIGLDGGAALTLSGASQVATTVVDNGALIVTGSLASAFAINPHGVLRGSVATLLAQGPIADDGSLVLDQASDATLSTSVVGSGGLTLTGGGALTLSGVSQLGSVDVSAGTLIVSGQLVGAFTIDAGGTLEGSTANLLAQGAVTDNGSLVFTQGSNAIFANDIDGVGAITKQGGGLLVLNGVSQVAQTTVAAGNLQVGDFAHASAMLTSNVTVNSGATLSGHGTVVGEVINNGVVSPGGTIGVLTIKGDFTQGAGGTLALEIGPSGSSELEISGKATLAGALQLDQDPGGIRKGQVFDLLTAGSISGAFGQVDSSGNVKFDVSTIGDTLVAVAENGNFAIQGGTPNQRSIAIAFNNFPAGVSDFDPLATSIINLSPGAEQDAALNQLGSEIGPDLMSASRDSVRALLGSLGDQLQERTAAAGGGGSNDPVWLGGFGRFGSASSDGDAHGFRSSAGGLSGGVQLDFGADTTLGAAVSYDNTTLTLNGLAQRGSVADTSAGLYGEQRWGGLYADLGGVWGYDHASEHRSIVTPGVSRVASASFSGSSGGVQATFGDRIATSGGWTIAPRAGVSWSEVSQGGYVETGAGGADLAVAASHQDAVQSLLGVRVSRTFAVTGGTLGAQASFDWAHDFDTLTPVAAESFAAAAGTGFSISGVNPGRDAGLAHLGLVYQASRVSVFARYEGSFSRQQNQNAVEAGVKVAF
ncbi:MAG TPA: autotransporter domain-containing protein [Caulobacteraceae bacterium]